jgi:hypothetical protein
MLEHCYKTASPMNRLGTVQRVALFHFATKSAQDFRLKMLRGSGMSMRAKGYDYFNKLLRYVFGSLDLWVTLAQT